MIRHIVAVDRKRGIAKEGVQPWKLPSDERYFRDLTKTLGGVVLMGATTFRVIGRPLPERHNFVATRDSNFRADGVELVYDIDAFLDHQPDVWVIGGAQVYEATLRRADELYVTEIDADFDCDVFYPDFSGAFMLAKEGEMQHENGLDFRYDLYTKRP
jgi:dihydrofolate reductase